MVVKGTGLGKQLGYPTANLQLPENWRLDYGIYVTDVQLAGVVYRGALYWGTKGGTGDSLEIYIFNFNGDLYGKKITFKVGQFIRADRLIKSETELKAQIRRDVALAKKIR